MPSYTPINNLQYPVRTDPPNVETAVHPLAKGAERRCLNYIAGEEFLPELLPDPSEGMIYYNESHGEYLLFVDGQWRAATPRLEFLNSTVVIPSTSNVEIWEFILQPRSLYRIEGSFLFDSDDDAMIFELDSNVGGHWTFTNNIQQANTAVTINATSFPKAVTFFGVALITDAANADHEVIFRGRKAADTGADAEVFDGMVMIQRVGAWVGT